MVKVVKNISAVTLFRLMAGLALAAAMGCRRAAPEAEAPARPESAAQETAASAPEVVSAPVAVVRSAPVAPATPAPATTAAAQQAAAPAAPVEAAKPPVAATGVPAQAPAAAASSPAEAASPAASEPTVADLRRAFATYDQQLRREDPVVARLNAENATMQQAIASNQTAILERLQADPEWVRLRGELVEFQRASDARQRQALHLHRTGATNAPQFVVPRRPPGRPLAGGGQP